MVIECPEFRKLLLLLREDLQDKDIPHRTKIRESIIKAWQTYFARLKADLAVRTLLYLLSCYNTHTYFLTLECRWKNQLHCGCVD